MIKVKKLIELLSQLPGDATVKAYEGEDTGLSIGHYKYSWWIRARDNDKIDTNTEGFERDNRWGR